MPQFDALMRELQALEAAASRAGHARVADAARRRAAGRGLRRRWRTPRRCSASTTPTTKTNCARSTSACARASPSSGAGQLCGRTQDRRPEHRAHLRRRPARARRHARRRRARRGRHDQRAHHPRAAARPARRAGRAGSRCAARCICRRPPSPARTASGKRRGSRSSPIPRNTAAGAMRNLDPAHVATRGLRRLDLPARRAMAGPCRRRTRAAAELLAGWGLAGGAALAAVRRHRRGVGVLPGLGRARKTLPFETDGVVVKLDDVAQRERLGVTTQVPAVGHRVQVPGRAGHDRAARRFASTSAAPARPRPTPCSSRCSSPAPPSRWPRCTTPRTWRARTFARATRSSSKRPAT